jgi:hypothetical protein
MVNTKRCGNILMDCDNDGCFGQFIPKVEDSNAWIGSEKINGYSCSISYRIINAENTETRIFNSIKYPCKARDLECPLLDSIIIWNKDVIHECPYELVRTEIFTSTSQNRVYSKTLLFQIVSKISECNLILYKTSEGLFISNDINAKKLPEYNVIEKYDITSFYALSELDRDKWELYKKLITLDNKICTNFLSLINTRKTGENGFFTVYDINGNQLVLQNLDGIIYVPQCKPINKILISNTTKCYKDIPISFNINNISISGFIQQDNILTRYSSMTDCRVSKNLALLVSNRYLVTKKNNSIFIDDIVSLNINFEKISKQSLDISQINFLHANELLEGNDIVSIIHDLTTIDETNGIRLTENNNLLESSNTINEPVHLAYLKLGHIGFIISILSVLLIILVLIFMCLKFGCCNLKCNKGKKDDENIEISVIKVKNHYKSNDNESMTLKEIRPGKSLLEDI